MKRILYAIAFLSFACPAYAQGTAGNLLQSCTVGNANTVSSAGRELYCTAFFIGFGEGLAFGLGAKEHAINICLPTDATSVQIRIAFEKYMRAHPEDLNSEDHLIVPLAIATAYPCKK